MLTQYVAAVIDILPFILHGYRRNIGRGKYKVTPITVWKK